MGGRGGREERERSGEGSRKKRAKKRWIRGSGGREEEEREGSRERERRGNEEWK